jgi:hypothetical protein
MMDLKRLGVTVFGVAVASVVLVGCASEDEDIGCMCRVASYYKGSDGTNHYAGITDPVYTENCPTQEVTTEETSTYKLITYCK